MYIRSLSVVFQYNFLLSIIRLCLDWYNAKHDALTLSNTIHFRLFQTQKFADDNSKFDENGRMFSKRIENTVGKGEIARYEQFLVFPLCFQKTCTSDM